jgi:hypothetical protein
MKNSKTRHSSESWDLLSMKRLATRDPSFNWNDGLFGPS